MKLSATYFLNIVIMLILATCTVFGDTNRCLESYTSDANFQHPKETSLDQALNSFFDPFGLFRFFPATEVTKTDLISRDLLEIQEAYLKLFDIESRLQSYEN
ncbi:MAG: hypothetical protein KDD45_14160, partial [Bdellovibrionales bacterium]|nr:hypothetical protein [Bdellovibrionales bacterium]